MEERLQKLMARAGVGSRRKCEKIIEAGRVKVNGKVASLGDKANSEKDEIMVNGRLLYFDHKHLYIALNKPKGVISSLEDELDEGRETVRELIEVAGHLYPVGRLDKQSEGLILMTNDGDLAHRLTHPSFGHQKTYHVTLDGMVEEAHLEQWRSGLLLEDKRTLPARVNVLVQLPTQTTIEITMREGRKRQIRKIATLLGYTVQKLVRVRIATLELGGLRAGKWRYLTTKEVKALKKSIHLPERENKARKRNTHRRR